MFEVTLVPILVAAILNMIFGMVWYNPKVFGTMWMRGANISPEAQAEGKKKMPILAVLGLLSSMLAAYVLNHFGIAWGVYDVVGAIELGIWVALGFTIPALFSAYLWERKPFSYLAINASYWILSFILMAIVLVLLSQ